MALPLYADDAVSIAAISVQNEVQNAQQASTSRWDWANPRIALIIERNSQGLVDALQRAQKALDDNSSELAVNTLVFSSALAKTVGSLTPNGKVEEQQKKAENGTNVRVSENRNENLAPLFASLSDLNCSNPGWKNR